MAQVISIEVQNRDTTLTSFVEVRGTFGSLGNESLVPAARFEAPPLPRQPSGYQPRPRDVPPQKGQPLRATLASISTNAMRLAAKESNKSPIPMTPETWEPPKQVDPFRLPPNTWTSVAGGPSSVFKTRSKVPINSDITQEPLEKPSACGQPAFPENSPMAPKTEAGRYVPPHMRGLPPVEIDKYVQAKGEIHRTEDKEVAVAENTSGKTDGPEPVDPDSARDNLDMHMKDGMTKQVNIGKNAGARKKYGAGPNSRIGSSAHSGVKIPSDQTWEAVEGTRDNSPSDEPKLGLGTPNTTQRTSKGKGKAVNDDKGTYDVWDDKDWHKVKANANGKHDHENNDLTDFEGKLAPAPVDWELRPLYTPKHDQNKDRIQAWSASAMPINVNMNNPDFATGAALATGEESFQAIIDKDVHETKPYGDPYTDIKGAITADQAAEEYAVKLAKLKAEEARNLAGANEQKQLTRKERKEFRHALRKSAQEAAKLPRENAPRANIYLRPAEEKDLRQVKAIYDYYVRESTVAPERDQVAIETWHARFVDIIAENHPFIVAAKRGRLGGEGDRRREGVERIAGFALAEDIGVKHSAYRFTCETHVYVNHTELRQDVGKCLLDRLLARLDNDYIPRCGVDWYGGELEYTFRDHKVISFNFPYAKGHEEAKLKWIKAWLEKSDFELTGTLPGYGYKNKQM